MSKNNAYYFKFNAPTWLASTSKVQLLSYEEKGIFIELCALILMESGRLFNDEILHRKMRLEKPKLTNCLNLLLELNLLVLKDGFLSVKFITEALDNIASKRAILKENGRKGGRPKTNPSNYNTFNNNNINISSSFIFPKKLDTPEFQTIWKKWETHLKEKQKPLKPTQRDLQLMKLAGYSVDIAVKMVEQSIANGWLSFYELKPDGNKNNSGRPIQILTKNPADSEYPSATLKGEF